MARIGIVCTVLTVTLIGNACGDAASETSTSVQPRATASSTTTVDVAPSSSTLIATTTSVPTTSLSQPASTTTVLAPIDSLASGLFCRDLAPAGYSYTDAVTYWTREGQPQRMDADRNGIPCETVFDHATVVAFWGEPLPTTTTTTTTIPVSVCRDQSSIPDIECEALVAFYHETDGPNWTNTTGWLTHSRPCTWHGVVCGPGNVVGLSLPGNQLSGAIPPELGDLTTLTSLVLNENQLSGSIPPELGDLASLTTLELYSNRLTGSIPPELGNLANLLRLWLLDNQLTGSIPPELGDLANLDHLLLFDNQLTGSIPSELGDLSKLGSLILADNQLTGSIPPELGALNIWNLHLSGNQLSGAVPPELSNLTELEELYLYGQSGCLTAAEPSFVDWLTGFDPAWNDGCPSP